LGYRDSALFTDSNDFERRLLRKSAPKRRIFHSVWMTRCAPEIGLEKSRVTPISNVHVLVPRLDRMERVVTLQKVARLHELLLSGDLNLRPEFQRNSVWPPAAKAYLIDTILHKRPIPIIYLQRSLSAQSGRPGFAVVDGQQRLRALFEFLSGEFRLTQSGKATFANKYFGTLSPSLQRAILDYEFIAEEITGYSDAEIRDTFARINRYVVPLSPQERRHALVPGKFHTFVQMLGAWPFWREHRVFSRNQLARMRADEFAAELVILLVEGPQDKKLSVDQYYAEYFKRKFPEAGLVERRLASHLGWITKAVPTLSRTRWRKPVDLYALVGALESLRNKRQLRDVNRRTAGRHLQRFARQMKARRPVGQAARYLLAASRQTDNIAPRMTRIEVLVDILRRAE
jgi:hypothetical protein